MRDAPELQQAGPAEPGPAASVHRAWIYSACLPGAGEWICGRRGRGAVVCLLFLGFFTWLCVLVVRMLIQVMDILLGGLYGTAPQPFPSIPYQMLFFSGIGAIFLWQFSMLSAVGLAVRQRAENGDPEQRSVVWSAVMAYFSPGAGHVYLGFAPVGYALLAGTMVGFCLRLPEFAMFADQISGLVRISDSSDLFSQVFLVQKAMYGLSAGQGKAFLEVVICLAVTGAMLGMSRDWVESRPVRAEEEAGGPPPLPGSGEPEPKRDWKDNTFLRCFFLAVLGYLAPGAGQLLQARNFWGGLFLFSYCAAQVAAAALYRAGIISIHLVDVIQTLAIAILAAGVIDAAVHEAITMKKGRTPSSHTE